MRSSDGIAGRSMARRDLDAVVTRDVVERSSRKLRQDFSRQPHGAHFRSGELRCARALKLARYETPVEARIVRDEDVP
jgi:hypothetical protein